MLATTIPPTPKVPIFPMVIVKVSSGGKFLVKMVTDWFITTDLIENVGKPLYPGIEVGAGVEDDDGLFQNQL